jgi:hypothetical protein
MNEKIKKMLSISKKSLLLIGTSTILLFNPLASNASEYIKPSNDTSLISESEIVDKGARKNNYGSSDIMPVLKKQEIKISKIIKKNLDENNKVIDYIFEIENEKNTIEFSSKKDYKEGDTITKFIKISNLFYNSGSFFKYSQDMNGQSMNPIIKSIEVKNPSDNSIIGYVNTIRINGEEINVKTEVKTALIGTKNIYEDNSLKVSLDNKESLSLNIN